MLLTVVEVQQLTADRLVRRQVVHRLTVGIRLTSRLVLGHILIDARRIRVLRRSVRMDTLVVDEQTTDRAVVRLDQRAGRTVHLIVKHLIFDDRIGQILRFSQLIVRSCGGWHHLLAA